jgi:hypothetical protein
MVSGVFSCPVEEREAPASGPQLYHSWSVRAQHGHNYFPWKPSPTLGSRTLTQGGNNVTPGSSATDNLLSGRRPGQQSWSPIPFWSARLVAVRSFRMPPRVWHRAANTTLLRFDSTGMHRYPQGRVYSSTCVESPAGRGGPNRLDRHKAGDPFQGGYLPPQHGFPALPPCWTGGHGTEP